MIKTMNNLTPEQQNTRNEVLTALKESICRVKFVKSDGTEREMRCTLQEAFLPTRKQDDQPKATNKPKKRTEMNIVVWDLEKSSWRSFNIGNLIEYKREN